VMVGVLDMPIEEKNLYVDAVGSGPYRAVGDTMGRQLTRFIRKVEEPVSNGGEGHQLFPVAVPQRVVKCLIAINPFPIVVVH